MAAEEGRLFEEPTLSVSEIALGIERAVRRAFPDETWIRGEIANLSRPQSGHVYFDLVDRDCSLGVTLWASDKAAVNDMLRRAGGAVRMTDGTEVRIRARVGYFPKRGRVSLQMLSIDPAYTLGRLAEARELLVRTLQLEGVLAHQRGLRVPAVPLRVGLVTSAGSAAAADFLHTLEATTWGWQVLLADTRVQGVDAEASIVAALDELARSRRVDVVCIVRGGGAKTDLAAFDSEAVARAIAAAPVPVLTGIGHETDQSVADLAAHQAFKTPTACAAHLVDVVATFLERCSFASERLAAATGTALDRAQARLQRSAGRAAAASRHHLRSSAHSIDERARRLVQRAPRVLDASALRLDDRAARVRALDPSRALARGWSITRRTDGLLVRSPGDVAAGEQLVTSVADGTIRSTVDG